MGNATGTEKKFHKRFPTLPDERVIDNFLCALLVRGKLLVQGSMYVTQNFVCFYANLGKKVVVILNFSEILAVRRCKILKSIPNSIEIHVPGKKYFWASFLHRDNAHHLIDSRWRVIRKKDGNPVLDKIPSRIIDDEEEIDEPDLGIDFDYDLQVESDSPEVEYPPMASQCCHENLTTINVAPRYTEIFPLTVKEFYSNFLSQSSFAFWIEFHSRDGYSSFKLTPWQKSAEECCFERQTKFRAPIHNAIHNAIAQAYTRVSQQQRCRFVSENELLFETSSHSLDVPLSNQFLVESRWTVINSGNGWCELNISVCVRFVKKNWFKAIVERNAIDGSREWFENWIKSASAIAENIKRNSSIPPYKRPSQDVLLRQSLNLSPPAQEKPESPSRSESFKESVTQAFYLILADRTVRKMFIVCFLIFSFLLISGLWSFTSSYSLQSDLRSLDSEHETLQAQYDGLLSSVRAGYEKFPDFASSLDDQCTFWKPNGFISNQFDEWQESLNSIGSSVEGLKESMDEYDLIRFEGSLDLHPPL